MNVANAGLKAYAQKELLCIRELTKVKTRFKVVLDRGSKQPCTQADKRRFHGKSTSPKVTPR